MVTPGNEIFQAHSNPDSYPSMTVNDDASASSYILDMSTASTQAMVATQDAIALPMWAHRSGRQGNV